MFYVVGSGPAGISCASALIKRGLPVTMIDAGLELEPNKQQLVSKLNASDHTQWTDSNVQAIKNPFLPDRAENMKLLYGSDFPYRLSSDALSLKLKNVQILTSFARGGLSNVWGAAILPFKQDDVADWPISIENLYPYYRQILSLMPVAAKNDDLCKEFRLFGMEHKPFNLSRQASAIMDDLERSKKCLNKEGFQFGHSRLAINSQSNKTCVYCGLCLHGCPYSLIYSSAHSLAELQKEPRFKYVGNVFVEKIEESAKGIKILARSIATNDQVCFHGLRVFVAAGVLASAKIIMNTLNYFNQPVFLKDSQYALLPMLRFAGVKNVREEALHTLAQIFLELNDKSISSNTVHLQMYTYNDFYFKKLKPLLDLPLGLSHVGTALMDRLFSIQAFLHSNVSSQIKLVLLKKKEREVLEVTAQENKQIYIRIFQLMRKLLKNKSYLKAIPLFPIIIGKPGRSFHTGGSFPMHQTPDGLQSDLLGRPGGLKRVHVVDASVFPSIPGTTITFTVMANAFRIACLAEDQ